MNSILNGLASIGDGMATTVKSVGSNTVVPWNPQDHAVSGAWYPYNGYWYTTPSPQICAGDVHVFPCPHCDKCKCGAATVKRSKVKP